MLQVLLLGGHMGQKYHFPPCSTRSQRRVLSLHKFGFQAFKPLGSAAYCGSASMWALVERAHDAFSCDVSTPKLGNGLGIQDTVAEFRLKVDGSIHFCFCVLIRQPSTNSTQESYVQLSCG